ncbi:MAG: hypothetical protein AB7O65_04610 [Candidatus Korobacteraceae bacterium]
MSSHLRAAFRLVWQNPSLALAELAWRWACLLAAGALLVFTLYQILDAIDLSAPELALARLYQELTLLILTSRALPLLVQVSLLILPLVAAFWIVVASVSRAAIWRALVARIPRFYSPVHPPVFSSASRWESLLGIHFLRVVLAGAAIVALLGCVAFSFPLPSAESAPPLATMLLWFFLLIFTILAWSFIDWFLELAPLFIIRNRSSALAAIGDVISLFQARRDHCLSISGWLSGLRSLASICIGVLTLLAVATTEASQAYRAVLLVLGVLGFSAIQSWLRMVRYAALLLLSMEPAPETVIAERTPQSTPSGSGFSPEFPESGLSSAGI